jgi:hypothetical protein
MGELTHGTGVRRKTVELETCKKIREKTYNYQLIPPFLRECHDNLLERMLELTKRAELFRGNAERVG